MKKKLFFAGMLVSLLTLSLIVAGCDSGGGSGGGGSDSDSNNPFKGTWKDNSNDTTAVLTCSDTTWDLTVTGGGNSYATSGSYTHSGNNATFTVSTSNFVMYDPGDQITAIVSGNTLGFLYGGVFTKA